MPRKEAGGVFLQGVLGSAVYPTYSPLRKHRHRHAENATTRQADVCSSVPGHAHHLYLHRVVVSVVDAEHDAVTGADHASISVTYTQMPVSFDETGGTNVCAPT